jgi:DoxX-like family
MVRLWTGRIVAAWIVLFLVWDGAMKLLKLNMAVEGTVRVGYPARLVVVIGLVELICVAAYVLPRTSILGAILLTGYLGGATATQVRLEDPWFLLPVLIGVLAWGALWLRDPGLGRLVFAPSTPRGD